MVIPDFGGFNNRGVRAVQALAVVALAPAAVPPERDEKS
jgi:hypothetical protein